MKAPIQDQHKLLELQELDLALARGAHQLKVMPAAKKLAQLLESNDRLSSQIALVTSERNDQRKALSNAEAQVAQVQERASTQRSRLDNSQGSPKELENIQRELEQLALRQSELEDVALETMTVVEDIEKKIASLKSEQETMAEAIKAQETLVNAEKTELVSKQTDLKNQRDELASLIDQDLMEEYEHCREHTGGLGAVGLRGLRSEGTELEFSEMVKSQIRSADPDEVIISEEHNLILVRLSK